MSTRRFLPAAFLAVLLIHSFSARASDPIQFSPADSYTVAATPFRMASGDFNKDGGPDLVVTHDTGNYSILMNNGSGGFTATTYTAGSRLRDVAVVQLAGDTIPDLVFTDYTNSCIYVMPGNGNGTFTQTAQIAAGGRADGITAGDFNKDGSIDVATANRSISKVGVFLGTSGGSFNPVTNYSAGGACMELAAGLVNGDTILDLVTANYTSNNISVLLGNGVGGFGAATKFAAGNINTDLALGDLTGDGVTDAVITASLINSVVILKGNGLGSFSVVKTLAAGNAPSQVRIADLNNNGIPDLAVSNNGTAPGLSLLLSYGYGRFTGAYNFHPDQNSAGLAVANFNALGYPDVATAHGNGTVRVLQAITVDTDSDLLADADEPVYGTSISNPDTDGDGMPDGWEAINPCLNPMVADAAGDPDFDTLSNFAEYQGGTNPCSADTDSDGMPDNWEIAHPCLNPSLKDASLDFDLDGLTNLVEFRTGKDPCSADNTDVDGDGVSDADEITAGANPLDPLIKPTLIKLGSDVRVTYRSASQSEPRLAWTGSEFGLTWKDATGGSHIYFRRLGADGVRIGDEILGSIHGSWHPSIVWSGSEFGLAWHDYRFRSVNEDCFSGGCTISLYFARVSADGAKIGEDSYLYMEKMLLDVPPSVIVWTGSEYAVSWAVPLPTVGILGKLARVSPDGTLIGELISVGVVPFPTSLTSKLDLVWTGSEFARTNDYAYFSYPNDVPLERRTAAGDLIGVSTANDASSFQISSPCLAWTGTEFMVGWRSNTYMQTDYKSLFHRLTAAGEKIGSDFSLTSNIKVPNLLWNGRDLVVAGDGYLTLASAAGDKIGPDYRIDTGSLVFTGSEYAVSYVSNRDGNSEIYFTRFVIDSDGDGLPDQVESTITMTDPLNWDSNHNGLADGLEDNDGDGINNRDEVLVYGTNPNSWDSDGDRLPDKYEVDNAGHDGGGLDPMNALDAAADFDGDGNFNGNEYWNGSDPWVKDPVPGGFANPGCYYWGDGDGDGIPAPSDLIALKLEVAGVPQSYRDILPHGIDTLDLDRDGYAAPADLILLKMMVAGTERPGGYDSQASALEVVSAPSGTVAAGSTTHVTVSVNSVGGTVPYAPGFGVVFEVVSGNAVLLGGDGTADGEAAGNRYDVSMEAALGARANMVVLVTGPGAITIGARVPGCGTKPNGRWNDEVVLSPAVVINP